MSKAACSLNVSISVQFNNSVESSNKKHKKKSSRMTVQTASGEVRVKVDVEKKPEASEIAFNCEGGLKLNFGYWKTKAGTLRLWQIVSGMRSIKRCAI